MEISEEFCPQILSQGSQQHYGRPKRQQKYESGPNNGVWSDLQHTKYIVFMQHNKDKMRSKQKRRSNRLYKSMSEYIGSRNALQCRSHHQKLQEKYLYPNKIISNYKQHTDLSLYDELRQELEEQEGGSSSRGSSNLKLQEPNTDKIIVCKEARHEHSREVPDESIPSSPTSHSSFAGNWSFRPYIAEQWVQPGGFNWCPYPFYPIYQML